MSPRQRDSRALARVAFGVVLSAFISLLFMSGLPTSRFVYAQSTVTPSGTASSPTATSGGTPVAFKINFLNPSRHSEELSTQDDNSDGPSQNTYHLVAWVNALPQEARVEFKYRINDQDEEQIIGEATQVEPGDTWEFDWDIPDEIPEGERTFTLLAILYSGDVEVARDRENDLYKNDSTPPSATQPRDEEEQGVAAEMSYPINGGPHGWYIRRDRSTQSMFDVTMSTVRDEDFPSLFTYYTISRPGDEPAWFTCGNDEFGDHEDGVRCQLSGSHTIEEVTAVAATAAELTCDPALACLLDEDSGDAHRVAAYEQEPTTITLEPPQQNEMPTDNCAANIVAFVSDQEDRLIANAPIDVHAVGPTDKLAFDNASGTRTSASQAPTGGHRKEETVGCETSQTAPPPPDPSDTSFQGDHDVPAGTDLKHLESALSGGTGDTGRWSFALYSPDRGETQITAWVDDLDDDVFCNVETSASASIGWLVPAPSPDGPDIETTECPEPTASPIATRSPTSTPSPTSTEDPRGCTILGTDNDETLVGTRSDDIICGLGGNDLIRGLGGSDTIYGDEGADEIRGGPDNDFADGGEGKDTIRLAGGNDQANGGDQNDVITGGAGNDRRLLGGAGFDTIRAAKGRDRLDGGSGDDTLTGGPGPDRLFGRGGRDILSGGPGRDRCRGGPGKDRLNSC